MPSRGGGNLAQYRKHATNRHCRGVCASECEVQLAVQSVKIVVYSYGVRVGIYCAVMRAECLLRRLYRLKCTGSQ